MESTGIVGTRTVPVPGSGEQIIQVPEGTVPVPKCLIGNLLEFRVRDR